MNYRTQRKRLHRQKWHLPQARLLSFQHVQYRWKAGQSGRAK